MTSQVAAQNLRARVQQVCREHDLLQFDALPSAHLSDVQWEARSLGIRLLPWHLDDATDQASRRPHLRRIIADWVASISGPSSSQVVLDLFSGCGTLASEYGADGVRRYCGVDINPAIVDTAQRKAGPNVEFLCDDASRYVETADLLEYTVVLLHYECLNALGKQKASTLLSQLSRRCAPGTWIVGDVRTSAHSTGVRYEMTSQCPYFDDACDDPIFREFGYTSEGKFFGSRYLGRLKGTLKVASAYSMLELIDDALLDGMLAGAGLTVHSQQQLLATHATDVPECSGNTFFAARTSEAKE